MKFQIALLVVFQLLENDSIFHTFKGDLLPQDVIKPSILLKSIGKRCNASSTEQTQLDTLTFRLNYIGVMQ